MTTIKIKRVYEPFTPEDGFLILADRLWPRGISKERMHGVLWAKDVAPSAELRRWFHENVTKRWAEFSKRYEKELESNGSVPQLVSEIKKYDTTTLLFAGRDTAHTHTKILKTFLEQQLTGEYTSDGTPQKER